MNKSTDSKPCRVCHLEKPLTEFSKDTQLKSGISNRCKTCDKIKNSKRSNKGFTWKDAADIPATPESELTDLYGTSDVWTKGKLVMRKGKVLDVGCTDSSNMVPLTLASLGWKVHGIDNRQFKFQHPNFHFTQGDIRNAPFPDNFFDCVCAVSTIEHIGLKGRYGATEADPEGDIEAVREIARVLVPGGTFLLTVPYGRGQLVKPLHRVYDKTGLRRLFSQWKIEGEIYYTLEQGNWIVVPEEVAAQKDYIGGERALALLELVR